MSDKIDAIKDWFLGLSLFALVVALLILGHNYSYGDKATHSPTVKILVGQGHGSGFHIGNGYVITAAHVVDKGTDQISVKDQDGKTVKASVAWIAKSHDIAMIHIDEEANLPVADLSCDPLAIGDSVSTDGNPGIEEFVTVWGRVSGKPKALGPWKSIQAVNMAVIPGQSGGPLYNESGQVSGVVVGVMNIPTGFGASLVGVGWYVPGRAVCDLLGRA